MIRQHCVFYSHFTVLELAFNYSLFRLLLLFTLPELSSLVLPNSQSPLGSLLRTLPNIKLEVTEQT